MFWNSTFVSLVGRRNVQQMQVQVRIHRRSAAGITIATMSLIPKVVVTVFTQSYAAL